MAKRPGKKTMMGRVRAEHVENMAELRDWARRLHLYGPYPCDALRRYAIGIYQIYQGHDWRGTPSEYESYAAAAIHVLAGSEALEIPSETFCQDQDIVDIPFGVGGYESLLYSISKLQAQMVYATNSASIGRKSRFEKGTAGYVAGKLVNELIGLIPGPKRDTAIYEAMEIMTGEL